MQIIAFFNLKGGVGKTTSAVNIAWQAANEGIPTLLWDLDPQGAAVEHAIHSLGLVGASQVRVGKTITFQLEGEDTPAVRQKIEQIARDLLANPVIEDFSYTIE